RTSAGTVAGNQKVKARIDELIAQRESIERKAIETAAGELAIDRKWVLSKLVGDHARASNSRQYSAAIRALELIGKELGMFVERRDVTLKYANLSDDDLAAALAKYVSEDEPRGETEVSPTAHCGRAYVDRPAPSMESETIWTALASLAAFALCPAALDGF